VRRLGSKVGVQVGARSDPLPQMRDWVSKHGENYHCL
jgi:hypothetical protein